MSNERLTDKQLANIRRRAKDRLPWLPGSTDKTSAKAVEDAWIDRNQLLTELDRERAHAQSLNGECIAAAEDQNKLRAELLGTLKRISAVIPRLESLCYTLDIDLPSDSGYMERVKHIIAILNGEDDEEGATDGAS